MILIKFFFLFTVVVVISSAAHAYEQHPSPPSKLSPVLITEAESTRAIALDAFDHTTEPFATMSRFGGAARITLLALNVPLSAQLTAAAETAAGASVPLTVIRLDAIPNHPLLTSIAVELTPALDDAGDVLISVTLDGAQSNRVRVGIGHTGGGPPDDSAPARLPTLGEIIFDGNSLTAGTDTNLGADFPSQVMNDLHAAGLYYAGLNVAVPGQNTDEMIADASATVDSLYAPGLKNVVVAWEGTNHFAEGATPEQAFAALSRYCAGRQAAGFQVVVLTVLPRSNPGREVPDIRAWTANFEVKRQALNRMLREHWSEFADALADVGADDRIGRAGQDANPAFYVQGIHLNDAGARIVATYATRAILSIPDFRL